MEAIPYSLYLSNSHHDQSLLILGEIESLQFFPDVVVHVVFGFWDIVSVRPGLRMFFLVDETAALAYVFIPAHLFNVPLHAYFLGMGLTHFNFEGEWRAEYQHCSSL